MRMESDDDRVRLLPGQWLHEQSWGKTPAIYDPLVDPEVQKAKAKIDMSKLSPEQRDVVRQYLTFMKTLPTVGL